MTRHTHRAARPRVPAARSEPTRRDPEGATRLLSLPRPVRRRGGVHRRRRPLACQRQRWHRAAADDASPGREPGRSVARREDRRVLGHLRRPGRDLHPAARRGRAGSQNARREPRQRRRLDARRRDPLRHAAAFDAAKHAARHARPEDGRSHPAPARAGERRRLRRQGWHALLHAPPVPGQPHAPLQGRHGAEHLEAADGRRRGGPPHRRLRRHQQDADAVERPHLLRRRPRRVDERLVDGRKRPRPSAAHEAPRLRRAVAVALEGPHRLPDGRRPPAPRRRQRRGQADSDHRSSPTSTTCASGG